MTDLIAQWLEPAALNVDPFELDRRGVTAYAARKVGGVRQGRGGWWALPVFVDPPSIYRMVDSPVLIDFLRFDPDSPTCWQAVYGQGVMLGEAALAEARLRRLPLPVFRDPLAWLQAAGAGVFPIDPEAFMREAMLYPPIELHPEDVEHGRELRAVRDRVARIDLPRIMVAA